mmetsp:Transcript_58986/g.144310  ORF Transcript_58986/g.144310 Transcript_58986/m.144310 type:complete len:92 (+) Transcript_58986:1603-1878(+)
MLSKRNSLQCTNAQKNTKKQSVPLSYISCTLIYTFCQHPNRDEWSGWSRRDDTEHPSTLEYTQAHAQAHAHLCSAYKKKINENFENDQICC